MKTTSFFEKNPRTSHVDASREHALLTALIAGEQERFYTNSLTTGASQEVLDSLLFSNYKVKSKSHIQSVFDFLKEEGERSAYNIMIPLFLSENEKTKRESAIQKRFPGVERLASYGKNLNAFLDYIHRDKHICITSEDLQRGILAWDLSKLIVLARIAADQQFITESEAWGYIEFADKQCRQHFTSWEEIGKSYLLGQILNHPGEEEFKKIIDCYHSATEDTQSPWTKVPF